MVLHNDKENLINITKGDEELFPCRLFLYQFSMDLFANIP